jgi:hypothetical protein
LGHAGSGTDHEINDWIYKPEDERLPDEPGHFGKADLTAMAYLRAYVVYIRDA